MLHLRIREAREAAGLSQRELAARAQLTRSHVQNAEDGANITVATLRKIAAQLPKLHYLLLALDGVELIDGPEAHAALQDLHAAMSRLDTALGAAPALKASSPAGATRFEPADIDPETFRRIVALDAAVDRGEIKTDDDS